MINDNFILWYDKDDKDYYDEDDEDDEKEKVDKKTSWRAETGIGFVMYYNSDR